jgi:hypothetical protein
MDLLTTMYVQKSYMHGTYSKRGEKELSLACMVGAAASRTAIETAKKQEAKRPAKERRKKESLGEKKELACTEGFCLPQEQQPPLQQLEQPAARDSSRCQEQLWARAVAATGAAATSGAPLPRAK